MSISCKLHDIYHIQRTPQIWLPLTLLVLLFGHLKNRVQGQQFESADEFLSGVRKILEEISIGTLKAVFREYIKRLDRYIALEQMESM
jgi:hypothetical protein